MDAMTDLEWADKLEHIASAITKTCYEHETAMKKYDRERKVTWDDADVLRILAGELRVREYRRLLAQAEEALR